MNALLIIDIIIIVVVIGSLWNLVPGFIHGTTKISPDSIPDRANGVQYIGHGTVLIQIDGKRILTDPVLTTNIALIERRFVSPGIDKALYPTINLILISHKHADHFQIPSLKKFSLNTKIIVPPGAKNRLKRRGFTNVEELSIGSSIEFDGLKINGVPAEHPSDRFAMGYVIEGSLTVYFAGDTALSEKNFRGVSEKFSIDIALLPIGCFHGSLFGFIYISYGWMHMGPDQFIEANEYLHPKVIVPIHWGTFIIGSEPIHEAFQRLQHLLTVHPLPVEIISHGKWESWEMLQEKMLKLE